MTAPRPVNRVLHASYALDGSRRCVGVARDRTRDYLNLSIPLLDPTVFLDVLTVVSEMVTNVVRHAPGPCRLYLVTDLDELTVAVSDTSTEPPRPRIPDTNGTGGFGWAIVTRLATRIDVYPRPPYGKTVCATIKTLGSSLDTGPSAFG